MTQTIFTIAVGTDDGLVHGHSASYPATYLSTTSIQTFVAPGNDFNTPNYNFDVILLRWDTSSLPDNATITSAVLRLWMNGRSTVNAGPYVFKAEWYAFGGTAGSGDYTTTVSNSAHVGTNMDFFATPASYDYTLQNLSNISLTGYTGMRLFMDGPQPTTTANYLSFDTFETVSGHPAQLVVDYTVSSSLGSTSWLRAL